MAQPLMFMMMMTQEPQRWGLSLLFFLRWHKNETKNSILIIKAKEMQYSRVYLDKELYMCIVYYYYCIILLYYIIVLL